MSKPLKEHEIQSYVRVRNRLNSLYNKDSYNVITQPTELSSALNRLISKPADSFNIPKSYHYKILLGAEQQEAGTLWKPNLEALLRRSVPSSFGRGDRTVFDSTYRKGREIMAADVDIRDYMIELLLGEALSNGLFIGQRVDVTLYKVAIYEAGGHFDWHRDSTHSDTHHGTVLVALNTEWEGGDLLLRCSANTEEMRVDLHPDRRVNASLKAVAFFTDTEHKVEPVISGTRVVLQFDVRVREVYYQVDEMVLYDAQQAFQKRIKHHAMFGEVHSGTEAAVNEVVAAVCSLHISGQSVVAFPLQHLYRRASVRPAFLKGVDQVLYHAFTDSGDFLVELHAVLLSEVKDYNNDDGEINMYIFDGLEEDASDQGDYSSDSRDEDWLRLDDVGQNVGDFYLNSVPALQQISQQAYVEHTGNEPQPACHRYFGGGMFVQPNLKKKNETRNHLLAQSSKGGGFHKRLGARDTRPWHHNLKASREGLRTHRFRRRVVLVQVWRAWRPTQGTGVLSEAKQSMNPSFFLLKMLI